MRSPSPASSLAMGRLFSQDGYDRLLLSLNARRFHKEQPSTSTSGSVQGSSATDLAHTIARSTPRSSAEVAGDGGLVSNPNVRDQPGVGRKSFIEIKSPAIVYCLPPGFVLIEHIIHSPHAWWAVTSTYFDYSGRERGATQYHESYSWEDDAAFDVQFRKLGIPEGDRIYARSALRLMMEIRRRKFAFSDEGQGVGSECNELGEPIVFGPGNVPLPECPEKYRHLLASGARRDLVADAERLIEEIDEEPLGAPTPEHRQTSPPSADKFG